MSFQRIVGNGETPPGEVTTLAFLSSHLPAPLISEHLARSLCAETGLSVVLVRLKPSETSFSFRNGYAGEATTVDWAMAETVVQSQFRAPSSLFRTEGGFHLLTLGIRPEPASPDSVASLLSQLRRAFHHVLVEAVGEEAPAPWLVEWLLRSDLAYLFLQANTQDVSHLDTVTRELRARAPNGGGQCKPILCLAEGQAIEGVDVLVERVAKPVHMVLHRCPTATTSNGSDTAGTPNARFQADVRRLAREVGGCLVGLALSSGAAKGFAHIGVIQVLEENGIEVDVVAGTSMGAYVGAVWAYGHDGKEMERLARELERRWSLWSLIDPVFPPRRGFLRGMAVKKRLMRSIGHARFGDLRRPLRVVAGSLATLEPVVFASGEVADAVHASVAVPGICVPVSLEGEIYIDGGIVNPLPVDVLREMGVARVIAVNAIPTPDRIRYSVQAERELEQATETSAQKLIQKVLPIDKQLNYFAKGNLFEILTRSLHGAQIRVVEASCRQADLVLRPDICDDRWLDFCHAGRFIALGREVAERNLEKIKALVGRNGINGANHGLEIASEPLAAIA